MICVRAWMCPECNDITSINDGGCSAHTSGAGKYAVTRRVPRQRVEPVVAEPGKAILEVESETARVLHRALKDGHDLDVLIRHAMGKSGGGERD